MSVGLLAAITSSSLRPALFLEANFLSGPLYAWSGLGPISWQGRTWLGVGSLGSISAVEEGADIQARGITISFGGFDPMLLSNVLGEFQVGQPVTVWFGAFNPDGTLISDPVIAFAGRMDQPAIQSDGQTANIQIACENRLVDMNTPAERRYTDQDQKMDYPQDRGLEFVNAIQQVNLYWGRTPTNVNNT